MVFLVKKHLHECFSTQLEADVSHAILALSRLVLSSHGGFALKGCQGTRGTLDLNPVKRGIRTHSQGV